MSDGTTHDELLFVGDVHLGRRPVGLDGVLAELGVAAADLSPAAALRNVVDEALARRPRAVVFAGDVVDQDKDRFEAYPRLERAVADLADAGVPVFGVAGNHDGVALPRLADRVDGFRLLGAGGTWERVEIPGEGRPIDLLGWSFPRPRHAACPLDAPSFDSAAAGGRSGATLLGVLHCDLDGGAGSPYAPVPRARLAESPLAAWFLGHVHQPGDLRAARPIGYLGSLVGLDPGEPGPRGPWRVRVVDGGIEAEQVPLVPVRFENVDVALDEASAADEDAVHHAVEQAVLERLHADPTLGDERLRLVVARATLTGRLARRAAVRGLVEDHEPSDTVFESGPVPVVVQRLYDRTRAAVDLDALAEERSPLGHVARTLVALREGDGAVLERAGLVTERVAAGGWRVDAEDHPVPAVEQVAERAAWRLLDELLAQREEAAG